MAENTEIIIKDGEKYIPYPAASISCNSIGSVVPIGFAREQVFFNNELKSLFNIDQYVVNRLRYNSVEELCKAFGKEQIDAIATAIFNWERNGNAMIISDQTGVGKGRIAAGLIRYAIVHLKKRPIFFTEKPNLFSDIFRDLYDIGLDAGISIATKPKKSEKSIITFLSEELTDAIITKTIKRDIKNNESLRVDYSIDDDDFLDKLFTQKYEDELDEIIDLYREHILQNGMEQSDDLVKVSKEELEEKRKEAEAQGRIEVLPYGVSAFEIINNSGNLIYNNTASKAKEGITNGKIEDKYKIILLTYSALRKNIYKNDVITPKGTLIFKLAEDNVLILDESHNAAGNSLTAEVIKSLLRSARFVTYISATWAKRPDNLPLYSVRTSIKDAFLSDSQIETTFRTGGLALQEAVSSKLVSSGELIRREIPSSGTYDYMYEDENSTVGQEQISLLNQITLMWDSILEHSEFIRKIQKNEVTKRLPSREDLEERKRFKYKGSIKAKTFQLFSFFLLSLKVQQCINQALEELRNGRKVVIAISSTLESAFDNAMRDYISKIPYQIGDSIRNDMSEILKYYSFISNRVGFSLEDIVDDNGDVTERVEKVNLLSPDWNVPLIGVRVTPETGDDFYVNEIWEEVRDSAIEGYQKIISSIYPLGLPLSPIDVIKAHIIEAGFSIEEITGRSRELKFNKVDGKLNTQYGIISNRKKPKPKEVVNNFNANELDCIILNVAGATGLSLHAIPTKDGQKIVEPVNIVPKVIPTSLFPTNEVKQRCMLIVQMELNVATEQQKLGRISRNGQVLPPSYKYIISAIPSEARLTAMMQKKLKSLMANTTGESDFGKDTFNVDDLFSDTAVIPWNDTCRELSRPNLSVKNAAEIESKSKMLYFASYSLQVAFFTRLQNKLNKHILDLTQKGQYFGKMAFKEYNAETKAVIPFIIGDSNATSDFANHSFLELAKCDSFDVKNSEYLVAESITNNLTFFSIQTGNAKNFTTISEWKTEIEKETNEFALSYIEDLNESINNEKNSIESLKKESEEYKKQLEDFPNGDEILRIQTLVDELKTDNKNLLEKLMQGSTDPSDALRIQETNAQLSKYNDELNNLTKGEDVSSITRQIKYIQRNLRDNMDSIDSNTQSITRFEDKIRSENEVKDLLFEFTNKIGSVFKFRYYQEVENTNDEGKTSYTYCLSIEEDVVLCGVKYDFSGQSHLIKSGAQLALMGVTKKYSVELSKLYPNLSTEKISDGAKPKEELAVIKNDYKDYWDVYIRGIDTGYEKDNVFLSGNLLRGMAFNYLMKNSGEIVKYNTKDKKIKISLQLSDSSATKMMSKFNDDVNYSLMFGLNEDNIVRIIPQMIANAYWYDVTSIAMEVIFETNVLFLCVTKPKEIYQLIDQYKNENYERDAFIQVAKPLIIDKLNEMVFTFCSTTADTIKALDNIVSNLGSEYTNEISDVHSSEMKHCVFEVGLNGSGMEYSSPPLLFSTNPIKVFTKGQDTVPLNHIDYIMSTETLDNIKKSYSHEHYYRAGFNLSLSYSSLKSLIGYLKAMRIQFCAVTSADNIKIAEPSFVFDIASSATGVIDNNGVVEIDNIGNNKVDEIEDAISAFIEYYKNL